MDEFGGRINIRGETKVYYSFVYEILAGREYGGLSVPGF